MYIHFFSTQSDCAGSFLFGVTHKVAFDLEWFIYPSMTLYFLGSAYALIQSDKGLQRSDVECLEYVCEMSWGTTFPVRLHLRPARTPINHMLIRAFAMRMNTLWILDYAQGALRRLCSDCPNAQPDQSRRWVHMQTWKKCCASAH